MKYLALGILLFVVSSFNSNDEKDIAAIKEVLATQQKAWNNYDLEGFMQGYWKSEELKFYGSNGVTYGWKNTLERYKKGYPSAEHTGELNFVLNEISKIDKESYYVMGEYHLTRPVGDIVGICRSVFSHRAHHEERD